MSALKLRARCAPQFFDSLLCFLRSRCVEGEGQRVGAADLHAAFTAFMADDDSGLRVEPPSQRDLRALLEQLGFSYGLIYVRGTTSRGFRGLGLSPDAQTSA
jgi:hypothetical protein